MANVVFFLSEIGARWLMDNHPFAFWVLVCLALGCSFGALVFWASGMWMKAMDR